MFKWSIYVLCKSYVKFMSRGLTQAFMLVKKVCDENGKKETKKDKKTMGASYKVTREMRVRLGTTE